MGELVPHYLQDTGFQEQRPADPLILDKGSGLSESPVQGNLFSPVAASKYRPWLSIRTWAQDWR